MYECRVDSRSARISTRTGASRTISGSGGIAFRARIMTSVLYFRVLRSKVIVRHTSGALHLLSMVEIAAYTRGVIATSSRIDGYRRKMSLPSITNKAAMLLLWL